MYDFVFAPLVSTHHIPSDISSGSTLRLLNEIVIYRYNVITNIYIYSVYAMCESVSGMLRIGVGVCEIELLNVVCDFRTSHV